jgi:hypothetical protein
LFLVCQLVDLTACFPSLFGKGATKKKIETWGAKRSGWMGWELWRLFGFVTLACVWMYFCCCSGGCLCQGLQGAGVVYSFVQ